MRYPFKNVFDRLRFSIQEINYKYREPSLHISRPVQFALVALRIYLLVLIGLMLYKFITLLP